jgi:hypothetical protein
MVEEDHTKRVAPLLMVMAQDKLSEVRTLGCGAMGTLLAAAQLLCKAMKSGRDDTAKASSACLKLLEDVKTELGRNIGERVSAEAMKEMSRLQEELRSRETTGEIESASKKEALTCSSKGQDQDQDQDRDQGQDHDHDQGHDEDHDEDHVAGICGDGIVRPQTTKVTYKAC